MITLLLPADGRHIAQLYRLLRALLWLVLLLTVAAEWLLLDHSRLWPALPLLLLAGLWLLAARRLQQQWQLQHQYRWSRRGRAAHGCLQGTCRSPTLHAWPAQRWHPWQGSGIRWDP